MKRLKMSVIVLLTVLTIINIAVTAPLLLDACICFKGGQIFCEGDCCGGSSLCDCYDMGADNCTAPGEPEV
jgi:hypothetical protein